MKTYFVYDQDCGFCQRWAAWAISRGADAVITFVPRIQSEHLLQRAGVPPEKTLRVATLITESDENGCEVYYGAAAINGLLAALPGGKNRVFRLVASLYQWPVIHQLQNLIYPVIAKYRHYLFKGACPLVLPSTSSKSV